jgi:hypothetical protein
VKDIARNIIICQGRAVNSPWNTALVQIRDPSKRQPIRSTNEFFSEETPVCQLLVVVVYAVHLGTSKLTLFLQNVLQPSSISELEGRVGHLAPCQQNETNEIVCRGPLTRLQAMDIDPPKHNLFFNLRPT